MKPSTLGKLYMDSVVMLGIFVVVVALAATIEFPLADKADPTDNSFVPVPKWYFLFHYQLLKYVHGPLAPLATWLLPGVFFLALFLLPFIDRNPQRRVTSRPVTLGAGFTFLIGMFVLLFISLVDLYALSKIDPSVLRGQELVAKHSCKTCHRIHGEGAAIAPDLSFVADRRPEREWHLKHFRDPKSVSPGSFMPKFPLTDPELNDLTNYVLTLKSGT